MSKITDIINDLKNIETFDTNPTLDKLTVSSLRETSLSLTGSNIDLNLGNMFYKTLTANTTFTVTNITATDVISSFLLEIENGGNYIVGYPANTKWALGAAPTLTTNGKDILGFYTRNNGTTWHGVFVSKDIK